MALTTGAILRLIYLALGVYVAVRGNALTQDGKLESFRIRRLSVSIYRDLYVAVRVVTFLRFRIISLFDRLRSNSVEHIRSGRRAKIYEKSRLADLVTIYFILIIHQIIRFYSIHVIYFLVSAYLFIEWSYLNIGIRRGWIGYEGRDNKRFSILLRT